MEVPSSVQDSWQGGEENQVCGIGVGNLGWCNILVLIVRDLVTWFDIRIQITEIKGIGAIVHCSLANHMSDCVLQCPYVQGSDIEKQSWMEAVDDRIQRIKITRPGSPFTWRFVGVYQHVAKSSNRTTRTLVRDTLRGIVDMARQDGCRMAILGDFNAAPPGGRWGYSRWSAAAREDRTMTDWVLAANLTEVFPARGRSPKEGDLVFGVKVVSRYYFHKMNKRILGRGQNKQ